MEMDLIASFLFGAADGMVKASVVIALASAPLMMLMLYEQYHEFRMSRRRNSGSCGCKPARTVRKTEA